MICFQSISVVSFAAKLETLLNARQLGRRKAEEGDVRDNEVRTERDAPDGRCGADFGGSDGSELPLDVVVPALRQLVIRRSRKARLTT